MHIHFFGLLVSKSEMPSGLKDIIRFNWALGQVQVSTHKQLLISCKLCRNSWHLVFQLRRLNGVCTQACTALTTTGDKYQTQNFIIPAPNRLNDLNKHFVIITFVASFIQTVTSPSNGKAFRSCCLALCKKSMSVRKQIHITHTRTRLMQSAYTQICRISGLAYTEHLRGSQLY